MTTKISEAARAMGKKGGAVAQSRRTPEQRKEWGSKGGKTYGENKRRRDAIALASPETPAPDSSDADAHQ